MAKNIIVCSDGTGNTAIKGRGTNVFKIFEAIDLNSHRYDTKLEPQVAIYDDGVGTESFKPLKLLGGVFGVGLSRNVRQLYKELCRIYDPGDRIYLFGFSRGAFTVRTLAGLIGACGILKTHEVTNSRALEALVADAYRNYRRRYRTWLLRKVVGEPNLEELTRFKAVRSHGGERIELIGVWDTVDAVGLPFPAFASFVNATIYQFKFPSLEPSSIVKRAYHALAVDDERHSFHPLLWNEPEAARANGQVIEQVWFAGAHSNVGGGYPKQGMSLVALDWMMKQAADAQLRFIRSERDYYHQHANVDDKLYDPRTGFGAFYRWLPRNIAELCRNKCVARIHLSVLERAAHGTEDYAPGNLPGAPSIVFTATDCNVSNAAAAKRAQKLEAVVATGRDLLGEASKTIQLERYSYVVVMSTLLLAAPLALLVFGPLPALGLFGLSVAIAWPIAHYSKRSRQRRFSTYWLAMQQNLRDALKSTRDQPIEESSSGRLARGQRAGSSPDLPRLDAQRATQMRDSDGPLPTT
jgi:uncharacterized protein (DUF2235 family)